jgi:hypothetical protein
VHQRQQSQRPITSQHKHAGIRLLLSQHGEEGAGEGVEVLDIVGSGYFSLLLQLPREEVDQQADHQLHVAELPAGEAVLQGVQELQEGSPQLHLPQLAPQRPPTALALLLQRQQVGHVHANQFLQL